MKNLVHEPISGKYLRAKRASAGIPGFALCRVAGISRGRLSEIETGIAAPREEDLRRIDAALDEIIRGRNWLQQRAAEAGLSSLSGVRL
jgi:transcriptional regulator with XRE-family HTH domain